MRTLRIARVVLFLLVQLLAFWAAACVAFVAPHLSELQWLESGATVCPHLREPVLIQTNLYPVLFLLRVIFWYSMRCV
jgi:hypothetical protein